jgi:hypothetical protein
LLGKPVVVRVDSVGGPNPEAPKAPPPKLVIPAGDRKRALAGLPFFQKAAESLGAQIWHVEEGFNAETRNASEERRNAEFETGNEDAEELDSEIGIENDD